MTKDLCFKYLAFGLMFFPHTAEARPARYVWSNVANADYYQGTLIFGPDQVTFRTRSTWILVPEGSEVKVKPYTIKGRVIRHAAITPRLEVDRQDTPPLAKTESSHPPEQIPAPESLKVVPAAIQGQPSGPMLRSYMGLDLGLGRDRLTSSGGLYGYSGQSNIAPLTVGGLWAVPPSREWGLSADLSYHSFVASNEVEALSGGDSGQEKSRFTRLHAWLGGTMRVVASEGHEWTQTLDVSLGPSYVQLPILKVSDSSTGQASLVNAKATRIQLQGAYEWTATPEVSLGLIVRYAPFSLDSSRPSDGYGIHPYFGYTVAQGQMVDLGVNLSADVVSAKSSCDEGVDCPSKASSTSRVTDLRVGYRLKF